MSGLLDPGKDLHTPQGVSGTSIQIAEEAFQLHYEKFYTLELDNDPMNICLEYLLLGMILGIIISARNLICKSRNKIT